MVYTVHIQQLTTTDLLIAALGLWIVLELSGIFELGYPSGIKTGIRIPGFRVIRLQHRPTFTRDHDFPYSPPLERNLQTIFISIE